MTEANAAVVSQKALAVYQDEGAPAEADAAAYEQQAEIDADLADWRGGSDAAAPASRPAAARRAAPEAPAHGGGGRASKRAVPEAALPPGLKVIVIGGGVSGLKAAGDLQRAGAEVTLLEARDRCGMLLSAAGAGRCAAGGRRQAAGQQAGQQPLRACCSSPPPRPPPHLALPPVGWAAGCTRTG